MPPVAKPRLFLSYGWQDNAALVQRLKADLQADGWDVWQDRDRITGGDAFTAEIEDGIRWCDVLLAVMGPHSTRRANDPDSKDRRDSICQREISMADTVKGHGRIVPVMAVDCSPPLLLQGLDYIDMVGCPQAEAKYAKGYERLQAALDDARRGHAAVGSGLCQLDAGDFQPLKRKKGTAWLSDSWVPKVGCPLFRLWTVAVG